MPVTTRTLGCWVILCSLAVIAAAQSPEPILANQNRVPAGNLENGVLTLHLEIRSGAWHPEADDGSKLYVEAFGEADKALQIPGPLIRIPVGTTISVTLTNKLKKKATVYGLNTRPGDAKAGIELNANESRAFRFPAGAPGTYFYWARTSTELTDLPPLFEDAQLNGAFIVDPPGPVPPDRIFVMDQMMPHADVLHPAFEVVSINGKSYPYTEPLEYTAGETIRWRVVNTSAAEHPMHLHGSFYQLLSLGDFEQDIAYAEGERQSVVTQNMRRGQTMMMEWKPEHVGRWLFHCHLQAHISTSERVPLLLPHSDLPADPHSHHDPSGTMHDMAGLVLTIHVRPAAGAPQIRRAAAPPHRIDLLIESASGGQNSPAFACSVRDGGKVVASEDKGMGAPMVVTRGEPVEITVFNHLNEPTTIHWHGIELESYYDGVMGGGDDQHVTPAIAPGKSFVARFTPNRAGTFIYHTHAPDSNQLAGGIYGPLIVLEPGERYDPEHDKLLVFATRDADFYSKRITLNGTETPSPLRLTRGVKYRLRLINIAPQLRGDFQLGSSEHPATWRAIAKDGAALPPRLAVPSNATLHITSGETYDFEFQSDTAGEIPLQFQNQLGKAILVSKLIVR